jgi:hypothetical protein
MSRLPSIKDLPRAERERLAALAKAEILSPVGAYDTVTMDGSHPLQRLADAANTQEPFFHELATRAISELRNPSGEYDFDIEQRRDLATQLGLAQDEVADMPMPSPYRRPPGRDQEPAEAMPPRGGYNSTDPDEGTLDPESVLEQIQQSLDRLDPARRPEILKLLATFIEQESAGMGEGAMDGGSVGPRANNLSAVDRRPPALDAQIRARASNNFQKRWGDLTGGVDVWAGVDRSKW